MPAHYICDGGCNASTATPDQWPEHGYAHKKRYCPKCEEGVTDYEKALDELHDKLAKQWEAGLGKARAAYSKAHPEGTLPDAGD